MTFTTRPELRGTFGMVASTHWLASAAGMSVLERGGNAFDAAVATGLTLQVVEPHLNGPGGEVPALLFPVDRGEPIALCGQGVAPGAATIERYRELGHELVPGTGVLAACVPGAFGGWLLLLEQFGTWRLEDVLAFAIGYAEHGFPLVDRIRATIDRTEELLRGWPGSRDLYLPAPEVEHSSATRPSPRRTAGSWLSRVEARANRRSRRPGAPITRASWPRRSIGSPPPRMGCSPARTWRAGALARAGRTARVPGADGLQDAALGGGARRVAAARPARRLRPRRARPAEFVHVVTECAKLAFADRDALYGDAEVPLETLLSKAYNDERRALIGEEASGDDEPGSAGCRTLSRRPDAGAGEPTRGDTVHLDVADRWGTCSRRPRAVAGCRAHP